MCKLDVKNLTSNTIYISDKLLYMNGFKYIYLFNVLHVYGSRGGQKALKVRVK